MSGLIEVREAYGPNLETVYIVTVNGVQIGGTIDKSGAGNLCFERRKDAENYAKGGTQ